MPYIPEYKRDGFSPATVGQLNFKVTELVGEYIKTSGLSYSAINEAIGVLECAKLELYRRIATPYEDKKLGLNGDVYPKEILP